MAFSFLQPKDIDPYADRFDKKRVYLAVGLISALTLGVLLFSLTLFSGSNKDDYIIMLAKQADLTTIVNTSQKRIKNADLAKINSDASLMLATNTVDLNAQLLKKFGEKSLDSIIVKKYRDSTVTKKLDDAELLDKFGPIYRSIIKEKIAELLRLAADLKNKTGGTAFVKAIDTYIANLTNIDEQLNNITLTY